MTDLQYPIGKFAWQESEGPPMESIEHIAQLPVQLSEAVEGLSDAQLDTPYRTHGWTIRQVVHHLADSHMNAYIRFKWTLTENTPVIKAYDEKGWAQTPEISAD